MCLIGRTLLFLRIALIMEHLCLSAGPFSCGFTRADVGHRAVPVGMAGSAPGRDPVPASTIPHLGQIPSAG